MTDIDGATLDAIETELKRRFAKAAGGAIGPAEQAITSSELADEITGEDAEANPKTREAVKILMRERQLPIVGDSNGYRIPTPDERKRDDPIADAIESLEDRIQGIKERQQLLREAERSYYDGIRDPDEMDVSVVEHAADGGTERDTPADPDEAYDRLTDDEQAAVDAHGFDPIELWHERHGGDR